MRPSRHLLRALGVLIVVALGLTAVLRLWPVNARDAGLLMRVEVDRAGRPVLAETPRVALPTRYVVDALPYIDRDQPFRVTWEGVFYAPREGPYTFTTVSDDGSWIWVDDRLVVDNGGRHGPLRRSGTARLTRGEHTLRIGYEQDAGTWHLEVRVREPRGVASRIEAYRLQLSAGPLTPGGRALRTAHGLLPVLVLWAWYAVYGLLLITAGLTIFRLVEARLGADRAGWPLGVALGLLLLVALPGVMWGLPTDGDGWAPDEVNPRRLVEALEAGFAAPWASIYPPLAYYLWSPLVILMRVAQAGGLVPWDNPGSMHLHAAMRAASLLASGGTLAWVYLLARQWGSRADALVAVSMAGLGLGFVYYAKVANVEMAYLYWLMGTLVVFTAYTRSGDLALVPWMAVLAALAIATKDQAAGYVMLLLPALPLLAVAHRWEPTLAGRLRAVVLRREWIVALALGLGVLAIAYLASWRTLAAHVAVIRLGRYSPMVPATVAGQLQLLGLHVELLALLMSPPVLALASVGLGRALWQRRWAYLAALLLPLMSYVFGFLAVIRYTYDRFLLGVALVLACAAAPVAVALWHAQSARLVTRVLLVGMACWVVGHGVTVSVLMRHDGRYAVEEALVDRGDASQNVGLLAPGQYLPRLDEQPSVAIEPRIDSLRDIEPYQLLTNTTYRDRLASRGDGDQFWRGLEDGSLGYTRVLRHRTRPPWWALAWYWPHFHARSSAGLTNVDKINPEIELWTRTPERQD